MPKIAPKIERSSESEPADGKPKYERLRESIVEEVRSGRLRPGDALPTEQQLALRHKIARSTVRQAMAALERDGLIRRVQGKGTFIDEQAPRRLRRGLDVFALVLPETEAAFYPSLQRSFHEAAWRVHNQILVCQSNNDLDRQGNIILQLIDKEVAGLAIVPVTAPATPAYQVRQVQKAGIPVVFCHRRVDGIQAPLLAIPFEGVGRLAARTLRDQGHQRLAFFAPHPSDAAAGYLAGFKSELTSSKQLAARDIYLGGEPAGGSSGLEEELLAALSAMLDRKDRPTAIFATFDSVAESIYLALVRLGLRVPQDISLIGFGGTARNTPTLRLLTSVTIDEMQIGRHAAELLDRMRRRELPLEHDETLVMPIALSAGQTLGPAPRESASRER
ncbi:MAG TPA: GntR family transcriptional regulator [Pirellulales bacterium]|nr:GntR family transcriptional regulator [Pirellulales bacterium]